MSTSQTGVGALIARLVGHCYRRAGLIVLLAALLVVALTGFVIGHFAMTTDTYALLSPTLPWRARETAFNTAFPQNDDIVIVVDGRTPEISERAAASLAATLSAQHGLFPSVERPDAGPFWDHEKLLFAATDEVKSATAQLLKAQPFLGPLAADPSLRGLMTTLSLTLQGIDADPTHLAELRTPIEALATALRALAAGQPAFFSWSTLITGRDPDRRQLRRIVLAEPMIDFSQLQPGKVSITAIRRAVAALQLDAAHGVRVRLTGSVPLQDEEFSTLGERAALIASLSTAAICLMLWLAVRSLRIIVAILITTILGLICATALGLAMFHRFNVISVAFIPLFVGLGIDIGIQFSVRYRAERGAASTSGQALIATGLGMGTSLSLAATAIAVGFLAFGPTAYYGVSQLGIIAGFGMLISLALNLTLLPALIALGRAGGLATQHAETYLTRLDRYVLGHRRVVLGSGVVIALICGCLLPLLHFDFNPMHLRNAKAESVSTLLDLMRDPDQSPNTLEVVRSNLREADQLAARFASLPEVSSVRTLSSFIPTDQTAKIALITDAADLMDLTLAPLAVAAPPSDAQVIESLNRAAAAMNRAATQDSLLQADLHLLAAQLADLALGSPAARDKASQMLIPGLVTLLDQLRNLLHPQPVSIATLPSSLIRQWQTPDGRTRVSVSPAGDSDSDVVLRRFIAAGIRLAPDATGTAISLQAGARAVVDAFIEAGALSFVAITCLLLIALRRVRDVAITMAPIVLTGLLTLGSCVILGQPLNFANIIALPLLFGIGVAFHIYFVMAWRAGGAHLLTSSLARGVFFSALATATGFGSLWASSHPGTASMGKLLMISLIWTLVSALLFQPALMGPPECKQSVLKAS